MDVLKTDLEIVLKCVDFVFHHAYILTNWIFCCNLPECCVNEFMTSIIDFNFELVFRIMILNMNDRSGNVFAEAKLVTHQMLKVLN